MTIELKYVNTINNNEEILYINYPIVDYGYFIRIYEFYNDNDIINILNNILKELDCTIEYNCGRICMTNYPIYYIYLSDYYFYLLKIQNQFLYNKYIDKLIQRHISNLVFEYENPYIINNKKTKTKRKSNNKFIKRVSNDIFSNKKIYNYYNPFTKEEINSDDPNLINILNNTKKYKIQKSTKIKKIGVPISSMTFTFKKK